MPQFISEGMAEISNLEQLSGKGRADVEAETPILWPPDAKS